MKSLRVYIYVCDTRAGMRMCVYMAWACEAIGWERVYLFEETKRRWNYFIYKNRERLDWCIIQQVASIFFSLTPSERKKAVSREIYFCGIKISRMKNEKSSTHDYRSLVWKASGALSRAAATAILSSITFWRSHSNIHTHTHRQTLICVIVAAEKYTRRQTDVCAYIAFYTTCSMWYIRIYSYITDSDLIKDSLKALGARIANNKYTYAYI